MTQQIQAAEQLLQSLPNPTKIKDIHLDIVWSQSQGDPTHTAAIIVGILALMIIAVAVCVTVYNTRGRR